LLCLSWCQELSFSCFQSVMTHHLVKVKVKKIRFSLLTSIVRVNFFSKPAIILHLCFFLSFTASTHSSNVYCRTCVPSPS
jgi:hypothetical protein